MATYKFSSFLLATSATGYKDPALVTASDTIIFDSTLTANPGVPLSAAVLGSLITSDLTGSTTPTTTTITTSGMSGSVPASVTFNFSDFAVSSNNFVFSDGSKLIIGDGGTGTTSDSAANTLTGTVMNDFLAGLGGDDLLEGKDGNDVINGGTQTAFASVTAINATSLAPTVTGGDTASYASATSEVTVDLSNANIAITITNTTNTDTDTSIPPPNTTTTTTTTTTSTPTAAVGGGGVITNTTNYYTTTTTDGDLGTLTTPVFVSSTTTTTTAGQDTGGAGVDTLIDIENLLGSAYNDTLIGDANANKLDGGNGADYLAGGDGADIYMVGAGDVVVETNTSTAASELDTVIANIDYILSANVETLFLTSGNNATGNGANNTIYANNGNNVINGKGGADAMYGGEGNDTYYVDNTGDTVNETNAATTQIDTIFSTISYSLVDTDGAGVNGGNVENLRLMGTANINGTGNGLNNTIYANTGVNSLDGGAGTADTVSFLYGANSGVNVNLGGVITTTISGGSGNDIITNFENITGSNYGDNIIGNFNANVLTGGLGNDTLAGYGASDTLIGGLGDDTYTIDASDTIVENSSEGTDLIISSVTFSMNVTQTANVENLTLSGAAVATNGTGNALNNVITGDGYANILTGLDGNDTLDGGTGSAVIDTLVGGNGNDTYNIKATGGNDVIRELSGTTGGIDTVLSEYGYSLTPGTPDLVNGDVGSVENLIFSSIAGKYGTGNALNNTITAYNNGITRTDGLAFIPDDASIASANNIFDGMGGADQMRGYNGNDTYTVDNAGDTVIEAANEGLADLIKSTISWSLGSSANVENLTLIGSANIDATGSTGNNILVGNAGNNIINGGAGADAMSGGGADATINGGGDTFIVDNVGDTVTGNVLTTKLAATSPVTPTDITYGIDLVQSSVTFTLGTDVDNLTLTGGSAINGTGNGLNNILSGNSVSNTLSGLVGNDTLNGYGGKDYLTGGTGADTFKFSAISDTTSGAFDVITDFTVADGDKIDLTAIFTYATDPTSIESTAFVVDPLGKPHLNYISGMLSGDVDGNATIDFSIQLTGAPTLTLLTNVLV